LVQRQQLEDQIEALEGQIEDIESALVSASEAGDSSKISSLGLEYEKIQQALTEKYDLWNRLSDT